MTAADTAFALLVYGLPAAVVLGLWVRVARRRDRAGRAALSASEEAGLNLPASLHPIINPNRCLGCATCIPACPEKNVIGLIGGKAAVIHASNCVGHGACKTACPTDAITLVLGTETRGVEIPVLGADFQTNVPGLFVAGELGGMGLIRNAVEQGRQVIASVASHPRPPKPALDVVIVGAGPAGLAASLEARSRGLRSLTLEQDRLGGTVAHFPRRKLVLTAPVELPTIGRIDLRETTKEELLALWTRAEQQSGIEVRYREPVTRIEPLAGGGFQVGTDRGVYETACVVLAIGRRGTPRRLEVPGEELPKVVYRLEDPADYRDRRVLVVGGGDSALEAATSIASEPGAQVAISYRGSAFARAKPQNRERIEEMARSGSVQVLLGTRVAEIHAESVRIEGEADDKELANDAVIVCAGGVLPTGFLAEIGVQTETKHGTPIL